MAEVKLSLPPFYDPGMVGEFYPARIKETVDAGLEVRARISRKELPGVGKRLLFGIDPLVDFVWPKGRLPVPGAVDGLRLVLEHFYTNILGYSKVIISADSHPVNHISTRLAWVDKDGNHPITSPAPFLLTLEDVESGRWQYAPNRDYGVEYVRIFYKNGYGPMLLFAEHCIERTDGAMIMPALAEALAYHATISGRDPDIFYKADGETWEQFGALRDVVGERAGDEGFDYDDICLDLELNESDIFGWAADFCVRHTMLQIMEELSPDGLQNITFRREWTSLVLESNRPAFDELCEKMRRAGIIVI